MLREIYFKISSMFFRPQVKELGKGCKLRLNGRIIGGKHVHFADGVVLEKGFLIAAYPQFGGRDNPLKSGEAGKGVWFGANGSYNRNLTVYCADSVKIGKDVLFGSNVLISDNEHGTDPEMEGVPYRDQPLKTKPVEVGDGCWICEDAKILGGAHIGEQCVVAAGAVVKGTYPARSMIAGMPAKVIRVWDPGQKKWVKPGET